jgi:hypothetical protein
VTILWSAATPKPDSAGTRAPLTLAIWAYTVTCRNVDDISIEACELLVARSSIAEPWILPDGSGSSSRVSSIKLETA